MIKEQITLEEVVEKLNELLKLDKTAMIRLIFDRVSCNAGLAALPEVQTTQGQDGNFTVGFLGIINSLFGIYENGAADGYGAIILTSDGKDQVFKVVKNDFGFFSEVAKFGGIKE